jgi:hypothetical protein
MPAPITIPTMRATASVNARVGFGTAALLVTKLGFGIV